MSFEASTEGRFTVVSVTESRLDTALAEPFKNYLFDQIDSGVDALVIDLSNIRFMDSSGLGVLVAALKKMPGKGAMKLAGAQPAVKDLFDLTSMEKLFAIESSVSDAVAGG